MGWEIAADFEGTQELKGACHSRTLMLRRQRWVDILHNMELGTSFVTIDSFPRH